jgi:hypothetical protein
LIVSITSTYFLSTLQHASVETLRKLLLLEELDDCHICPSGKFKHSKLSKSTSYTQELLERLLSDVIDPFMESYWGEKYCLLFHRRDVKKGFHQGHWSSLRRSDVGLKHH